LEKNGIDVETQEDNMANSFEQAFGWFAVINRLCNDDLTKHDQIVKTSILEALNQLVYLIEKDKEIERRHKKAMKGY
jgi:hypothetical protein